MRQKARIEVGVRREMRGRRPRGKTPERGIERSALRHTLSNEVSATRFPSVAARLARRRGPDGCGIVRKERNVWRILRFDVPGEAQPEDVFATRQEAGARLLELARGA
jgi:hypothetical protein